MKFSARKGKKYLVACPEHSSNPHGPEDGRSDRAHRHEPQNGHEQRSDSTGSPQTGNRRVEESAEPQKEQTFSPLHDPQLAHHTLTLSPGTRITDQERPTHRGHGQSQRERGRPKQHGQPDEGTDFGKTVERRIEKGTGAVGDRHGAGDAAVQNVGHPPQQNAPPPSVTCPKANATPAPIPNATPKRLWNVGPSPTATDKRTAGLTAQKNQPLTNGPSTKVPWASDASGSGRLVAPVNA